METNTITKNIPLGLKWAWLLWLVLLMNWLRIEDVDLVYMTILGILGSGFATLNYAVNRGIKNSLQSYLLFGVLAGALVTPGIFFLIVFKSSLHAHGFFEIPGTQLMDVVLNTGWWIGAGVIISSTLFWAKDVKLRKFKN